MLFAANLLAGSQDTKPNTTRTTTTILWPSVQEYLGEPVPEETFTHSHLPWSSTILYHLPPSTRIYSILLVQFKCLTKHTNLGFKNTKRKLKLNRHSTIKTAHACVCVGGVSLCPTVTHNTAQHSSDNLRSYPPDKHVFQEWIWNTISNLAWKRNWDQSAVCSWNTCCFLM